MPITVEQARKNVSEGEASRKPFELVWAECDNFIRSEQNLFRDAKGQLFNAKSIPANLRRLRHVYNILAPRFVRELAAYTALTPGFQVDPAPPMSAQIGSVTYAESQQAAVMGERQLATFWDQLHLQRVTARAKYLAVELGEGYIWTYYDSTKGKPIGATGKYTGKVQARALSPDQVVWRAGTRFEDSDFVAIRCRYSKEEILARYPGADADQLQPDSVSTSNLSDSLAAEATNATPNLITVYEYFEKPSAASPAGRHICFTGKTQLYSGDYPYEFDETNDDQWLVRYVYLQPEGQSRGKGMVQDGVDTNRAYNRRMNQMSEWHGLATNPMPIINRRIADTQDTSIRPGKPWIDEPALTGGKPIDFVEPPSLPDWVTSANDKLSGVLDQVTGQADLSNLPASAAASTVQQLIAQDANRRGEIARGFDDSDARVALRLLLLARKFYTEPRDLRYKGKTGVTTLSGVIASQVLPRHLNVHISSGTPTTPEQNAQMINQWIAQGLVPGPLGILAIQKNAPEMITEPLELNMDKQQRENGEIMQLDDALIAPLIHEFGQITAEYLTAGGDPANLPIPKGPWPQPSPLDNDDIHMQQMENWFLTSEWNLLTPYQKQVGMWHYEGHKRNKQQQAMEAAAAQTAQAESLGAQNAAIPSGGKILPSQPKLDAGSDQPQPQAATG